MTKLSMFTEDELELIFEAPGAVINAVVYADGWPGLPRILKQSTFGAKAARWAHQDENEFLRELAEERLARHRAAQGTESDEAEPNLPDRDDEDGHRPKIEIDPAEKAEKALKLTEAALAVLRERVPAADVAAYGAWLVQIATRVTEAGGKKTGGIFGKRTATDAEQEFLGRLLVSVGS